jgi:alcohol dehydrogenase (cytochrome c)
MAFDARDGHELWHFNVIPADGEPGADSWRLAAGARRSGGAVWGAYSLDPATGELFVSTGNPAPALAPGLREGANLYTDSVLALDAASGRLHWYVQATAGDALDYDLSAAPMLYADARGRRRVAAGSKDGNLYLIDRESHAIVSKVPVTTIENPTAIPTVEGVRACPGVYGGVAWNGPAFDPASGTLYVGSIDMCMIYKYHGGDLSNPAVSFGTMAFNSDAPGDSIHGWVSAVDGTSGKLRWRRWTEAPVIAGVTVTGGGLVLTGDSHGRFLALDAQTGALLRSFETGGTMAGGVVTYDAGGRQYVAYASGGVVRGNLVKDVVEPKVVIAALAPASHTLRRVVVPSLDPMPPASGSAAPSGARGAALYARLCTLCHGPQGEGLTAPRLRGVRQRADVRSLREIIEDPKPSMARFYPGMITEADVADLAAFLEAWN